jgi:rhodanese-related sulfurtransferase
MKRSTLILLVLFLSIALAFPSVHAAENMAAKLNKILLQAPANRFWQVNAAEVLEMIKGKKTDFLVVDVRPNPAEYGQGHIPGAIQIPVQNILQPASLNKFPKNKKIILVCVTGQTQNLPIIALRALGYNAYTMSFGMSSWKKGYFGSQLMQAAIQGANSKNYPFEK